MTIGTDAPSTTSAAGARTAGVKSVMPVEDLSPAGPHAVLGPAGHDIEKWVEPDRTGLRSLRELTLTALTSWQVGTATVCDVVACLDRLLAHVASRAAATNVGLRISASAGPTTWVRVVVSEHLPDHRVPAAARQQAKLLSSQLVDLGARWGVLCEHDTTTVWFELRVLDPGSQDAAADGLVPGPVGPADDTRAGGLRHRGTAVPLHLAPEARSTHPVSSGSGQMLAVGDLHMNLITRSVSVGGNRDVRLTGREFELLVHMMRRAGTVQSRRDLLRDVWGIDFAADTAVVEVTMSRLRRKLGSADLRTVKDAGYLLDVLPDTTEPPVDLQQHTRRA